MKKSQKRIKNFLIALAYVALYFVVSLAVSGIYYWWLIQAEGLSSGVAQTVLTNNSGMLTMVAWGICYLLFVWIGKVTKTPLKSEIGIKKDPPIMYLMACVLAIGCRFLVVAYHYFAQNQPALLESIESAAKNSPTITNNLQSLMWISCTILIAPFFEELLFRVLVMGRLLKVVRPWAAIVLQAAAFGALHGVLFQSIFAFAVGVVLGIVYYRTKNIKVVSVCHCVFNLSVVFMQENLTLQGSLVFLIAGILLAFLSLFYIVNNAKEDR